MRTSWLLLVTLAPLASLASLGCGAGSELIVRGADATAPPADARPDATASRCPLTERLSDTRRLAWSTCNNPNRDESCAIATDGRRICGCEEGVTAAEVCGFALVNFVGSLSVLHRAACDARTGLCECEIDGVRCSCRSPNPTAACVIRSGRNCCWNDQQ